MVQLFNEGREESNSSEKQDPDPLEQATRQEDERASSGPPGADTTRFEDAYRRLETLVAEMERGELPLEELLARFEEGVGLVRHCRAFLKQAQLRVEHYVEQRDGQWVLKELD